MQVSRAVSRAAGGTAMNPDNYALLIPLFGVVFGCTTFVVITALIFPSTRQALANWLHRRSSGGLDSEPAVAQLEGVNAQLAALRGEVYALRCEVAAVSQALPGAPHPPALPAPMARN
jgi:hypothetical protein